MGDLAKIYSRVTSTLDVLEQHGVTPEMWDAVRREPRRAKVVADAFRGDSAMSSTVSPKTIPAAKDSNKAPVPTPASSKSILSFLGTVDIPGSDKSFIAADNFVSGKNGVGFVCNDFEEWFLGKTEKQALKSSLCYHKLNEVSSDAPILKELGDKAETSLAELFHLLQLQERGQKGVLLTNGYSNIFYVRDALGELRAVNVRLLGNDTSWTVEVDEVTDQEEWWSDNQVFSRNPA